MGGRCTGGERLQSRFVAFEIIGVIKFVGPFLRTAFRQLSCFNVGGAAGPPFGRAPDQLHPPHRGDESRLRRREANNARLLREIEHHLHRITVSV